MFLCVYAMICVRKCVCMRETVSVLSAAFRTIFSSIFHPKFNEFNLTLESFSLHNFTKRISFTTFSLLFAIGTKNCLCACVANADRDYSQSKQSEECCKMRIVFSLVFDSYVCVLTVRIRFVRTKSAPETSSKVIKILKFSKQTDDSLCSQMHRCHT